MKTDVFHMRTTVAKHARWLLSARTYYIHKIYARIQRERQRVWTPLENLKNIRFLSNTSPDSLKNHKYTKPAFNVGPPSVRQFNGEPIMKYFDPLSSSSPFPAGDYKASVNKQESINNKNDPQMKHRLGTVSKTYFYWRLKLVLWYQLNPYFRCE